ncbi:hypothetical protein NFI95_06365 [Acetobacteraceae bacterium KSS8]|uniref:Uncharacterized protein n=1 Tax=Endosaccharibacter trunci TaxID=2812733 RepID=A0ABT1W5A9_9PROT|nr:hypothetical protein [Acetobacteraceae bacterium KSS8]
MERLLSPRTGGGKHDRRGPVALGTQRPAGRPVPARLPTVTLPRGVEHGLVSA